MVPKRCRTLPPHPNNVNVKNKKATKYFRRRPLPTQLIETLAQDGTMEFTIKITDDMEILPIIKYWLPHLRVIKPTRIQKTIDEELQSYLNIQT